MNCNCPEGVPLGKTGNQKLEIKNFSNPHSPSPFGRGVRSESSRLMYDFDCSWVRYLNPPIPLGEARNGGFKRNLQLWPLSCSLPHPALSLRHSQNLWSIEWKLSAFKSVSFEARRVLNSKAKKNVYLNSAGKGGLTYKSVFTDLSCEHLRLLFCTYVLTHPLPPPDVLQTKSLVWMPGYLRLSYRRVF